MATPLQDIIDDVAFVGLAVVFVHTGFNASFEMEDGKWSPDEFGITPSDAIRKCFAKHAPKVALPPPLAPPPSLLPPPY